MTSTDGGPWFYPDVVSARPGDTVRLHASATQGPCQLIVRRRGATDDIMAVFDDIEVDHHPIPQNADTDGCGWPAVFSFDIGDWTSGYFDLEFVDTTGASTHHFVCVRPPVDTQRADTLIVLNTNTYQAYNYWGGANSYANVDELQAGVEGEQARSRAIGRLSRLRPYVQTLIAPPPGAHRVVNLNSRGVGGFEFPGDLEWIVEHNISPYDGSAGFVDKWEHIFVSWAEAEGYDFDYATDHDFLTDADLLRDYACVLLVGHSEYWTAEQRHQLDGYTNAGGNLAVFSGNTGYWKVRWEDDDATLIAHKWNGETKDPLWADPKTRQHATHLWSHPEFERPEAEVVGLSFLYGGYHRLVMCVARGTSAYTVYDHKHWALEDTDLFYGDAFGGDVPLLGYENDGCPIRFDDRGLPVADGGAGVPSNLRIIAFTPATLFEPPESPHPPAIPPEKPEILAEIAYGLVGDGAVERVARGHAVMASFHKGTGEVFNAGTTEWAHGLAANDPYVVQITRNVLDRFSGRLSSDRRADTTHD